MAQQDIPRPRGEHAGPEPWPQPDTDPRDLDGLALLYPKARHAYTMRVCGPSTEGQDVTVVPAVPIGVIATALLLLQPGDVATIECVEEP